MPPKRRPRSAACGSAHQHGPQPVGIDRGVRQQQSAPLATQHHVDGTGRLQSIERETNPLYFDLIEAFGRQSGIPIVLNTSFNENEPIVDTPEQAVSCFVRTGLDALCLGNYIVAKPEHVRS